MMNKGVMKRILAFVLAAVMVLGLAGCGKKGGDNPNGELAKQYVYSWEELSIPIDASDYYDISMVSYLTMRLLKMPPLRLRHPRRLLFQWIPSIRMIIHPVLRKY